MWRKVCLFLNNTFEWKHNSWIHSCKSAKWLVKYPCEEEPEKFLDTRWHLTRVSRLLCHSIEYHSRETLDCGTNVRTSGWASVASLPAGAAVCSGKRVNTACEIRSFYPAIERARHAPEPFGTRMHNAMLSNFSVVSSPISPLATCTRCSQFAKVFRSLFQWWKIHNIQ